MKDKFKKVDVEDVISLDWLSALNKEGRSFDEISKIITRANILLLKLEDTTTGDFAVVENISTVNKIK